MIVLQTKQVRVTLLLLVGIFGLSAGYFAAQLSGFLLQPPSGDTILKKTAGSSRAARSARADTALILQNNIFDPAARGISRDIEAEPESEPVATTASTNLKLFGTVDGGENPLALIESNGKVTIYRVGAKIPGTGELLSVTRNEAIIGQVDGGQLKLTIVKPELVATETTDSSSPGSGIRSMGENRWSVSQDEVEKARNNLNQLLKSARLEPNIVNGQTEGFSVRMIRPKSLLAELGIRRGDTITRVNGVELNSPEKALQIFQQLREARNLKVDLKRGNENLTYEYEIN